MKKILINQETWETRVAVTWNGKLQNIYFASHAKESLERAFYKGVVSKVLPGIQTAFVDIGQDKAGFLHISEIDREMAITKMLEQAQVDEEPAKQRRGVRRKSDISKIVKEGEELLVQVSKEPVYEKGAKLSTCFILPGRFIVLMPNIPRIGVSKKIGSVEGRRKLRELVRKNLPEGMGGIIRTTAEGQDEKAIAKDIKYLLKAWKAVQDQYKGAKPEEKVYEDIDLPLQIIRDHLDDEVEAVITDNKQSQKRILQFIKGVAPEYTQRVQLYTEPPNIFEFYDIEKQIEQALKRKVHLKSGGTLIIESAEAMSVIDVNTGRFTGKKSLEDTILKNNLEAAEEIVRQLRLRNIGGLIVIDFVDMAIAANRKKLFQHFEKTLRERDKFQSVVLKLSEFGLVQMTRKRSGKTLVQQLTETCSRCDGTGFVKSVQTECHAVLRRFEQKIREGKLGKQVGLCVSPEVFDYLTSVQYEAVLDLEKELRVKITISSNKKFALGEYKIEKM